LGREEAKQKYRGSGESFGGTTWFKKRNGATDGWGDKVRNKKRPQRVGEKVFGKMGRVLL